MLLALLTVGVARAFVCSQLVWFGVCAARAYVFTVGLPWCLRCARCFVYLLFVECERSTSGMILAWNWKYIKRLSSTCHPDSTPMTIPVFIRYMQMHTQ
jgi:hypothetical protein